jgi:thermitase
MKIRIYLALLLFITIASYGQNSEMADRVLLKLKNEVATLTTKTDSQTIIGNYKIDSVSQKFHAITFKTLSIGIESNQHIYIIEFPEGTNIHQVIDEYYKTNEIEYAEPDYVGTSGGNQGLTPNDQYFSRQWGLNNVGTFSLSPSIRGADIEMKNAWNIEQGDSKVIVAIIDTGVKLDHPDLAGRIWQNLRENPNNGIDDDRNGYIDDVHGWDFVNNNNNPTDDHGHGTNVTGIIGANGNNLIGYAGVDWNCKLMILKALDNNNSGFFSWWAEAIYYAVDNGANVINMSLGATSYSNTLQNAVNYAINNNVTIVASMMNTNSNTVNYPAGFSNVIAVGATNPNDTRSSPFFWSSSTGSNYGNHISVVAPGNYIYGLDYESNTNYSRYWGGTSQAAPHVTGLVSLLLAQNPKRTPSQIKSIIETTAEDQVGNPNEDTPGWDRYFGHGRINAFKALSLSTSSSLHNSQNRDLSIFPNPFSDQTTILIDNSLTNASLTLYNVHGQVVEQMKSLSSETITLYRKSLPAGLYFIRLTKDNEVIATEKLVIKD